MPQSEVKMRRWTRAEYYRLGELGFFDNQRVELIFGKVVKMPAMKNLHAVGMSLTEDALRIAFGKGYWVRVQSPLNVSSASVPEPDLAVVPGRPRDYTDHPTTALLAVEVSDTTLAFDRRIKAKLYALAGIADYWILNLVDRELEVHRDPQPDPTQPNRQKYAQVSILGPTDVVSPLAAPQANITVADLLP